MASSSNANYKHDANDMRAEQTQQREQFIAARNEQGQFVPMGNRDYSRDYTNKDFAGSGSKEHIKDYGSSGGSGNNSGSGSGNKDYSSSHNVVNVKTDDKGSDMSNMLRHIENLESKLAQKDKQLHESQQRVEKFSARTREGMQSALDSLMKKWMDACETKDEKCKEQFQHGMKKLVENSAEENGVWQMMVAASALHQRQEHDLDKLRLENSTLKQRIDGHYATSESRTDNALGKRKAEVDLKTDVSHESTDNMWAMFAQDCGAF
jgi:hypothetical protein